MAPSAEEDPLALVRELRGGEQLSEADRSTLERFREFLWSHEAESVRNASHSVLENYPDWWCRGRRAPPGLVIEDTADLEEFYRMVGALHGLGIPLTLAERRSVAFRLFQDVEVWGTRDSAFAAQELVGPDCGLCLLLGRLIGEAFPGHGGFLDATVFDATGLSQTKGIMKTSLRFVWPSIVVDSDRAARLRDLIVHRLTAACSDPAGEGMSQQLAQLETRLRDLNSGNAWHSVFSDAAYGARSQVRLALCDRVSPLPLRAPERRPLAALGVLRFHFGEGDQVRAEWLCRENELDGSEWVKIGSIRRTDDVKLTEWTIPSRPGTQLMAAPSSTTRNRAKIRTAGGSDAMIGACLQKARGAQKAAVVERAGQLLTIERRLTGPPDQFSDRMEQHLGKAEVEADGTHVWRQPGGDARIVMNAADQRVSISGRPNQVRSLVVIVSPYTEAAHELIALQLGGSKPAGAPSEAYAPAELDPVSGESPGGDGGEVIPVPEGTTTGSAEGQIHIAVLPFESQGQGELGLATGDAVCVTHDPEGERGSGPDRWVFGRAEGNAQEGWFPLSHTRCREDSTPQ